MYDMVWQSLAESEKKEGRGRKKEPSKVTKVLKHRLLLNHNVTIPIPFLQNTKKEDER